MDAAREVNSGTEQARVIKDGGRSLYRSLAIMAAFCACALSGAAWAQDDPAWRVPASVDDLAESEVLPLTESELPAFAAKAERDPARRAELIETLRKASVVPWTPTERDAFVAEMSQLRQCEARLRDEEPGDPEAFLEKALASGELERLIRDYARVMEMPDMTSALDAPTCGRTELMDQLKEMAMMPMAAAMLGSLTGPQPAPMLRSAGIERLLGAQMMGGRCAPSDTFVRLLMSTPRNPQGERTADGQLRCRVGPAYAEVWNEAEHARLLEAMPQVRRCLALGNDPGSDLEGARARFAANPEVPRLFDAAYELLAHVGTSKSFGHELPADPRERSDELHIAMLNVGLMVERYHDGAEITSLAGARQLQASALLAYYIARLAPETCTLPGDFVPLLKLNSLAEPS